MLIQLIPSLSSQLKGVYNPKTVILHAVLLGQAFAHCPIFPTAASRRSLDRVSVPVWLIILSNQLPVIALVSRYLTNKLIGYSSIPWHKSISLFELIKKEYKVLAVVSNCYPFPRGRLTICYSPVRRLADIFSKLKTVLARLACVKHTASIHSEPGSNSP